MAGLLEQLTGATNTVNTQNAGLNNIVTGAIDSISGLVGKLANADTGTDGRGNTALSIQTQKLGELEAEQKKQEIYAAMGMDKEGAAKKSIQLANEWQANIAQRDAQAKVVSDKMSVGLFDNPLEFLWNQITLPDEHNKLAGQQMLVKNKESQIQEMNTILQQTAVTENAYKATLSAAAVADITKATASDIQQKDYHAQIQALSTNAGIALQGMQANEHQLNNINRLLTAEHQQAQLEISRGQLAVAQGGLALHRKQFDLVMAKYDEDQASQKALTNALNVGLAANGYEQVTDPIKIKALLSMPGEQGEKYRTYASFGLTKLDGGQFSYGAGVVDTLATMRVMNPKLTQEQQRLVAEMADVEAGVVKSGITRDNVGQFSAAVNKAWTARWKELNSEIKGFDNPLHAPPITYMKDQAAIASDPVFQKVIAPQIASKGLTAEASDKQILGLLQAAVDTREITPSDAGNFVSKYYTAAIDQTNSHLDPTKFVGQKQLTYNLKIDPTRTASTGRATELAGYGAVAAGTVGVFTGVGAVPATVMIGSGAQAISTGRALQQGHVVDAKDATLMTQYFALNSSRKFESGSGSIGGVGAGAVQPLFSFGQAQVK